MSLVFYSIYNRTSRFPKQKYKKIRLSEEKGGFCSYIWHMSALACHFVDGLTGIDNTSAADSKDEIHTGLSAELNALMY